MPPYHRLAKAEGSGFTCAVRRTAVTIPPSATESSTTCFAQIAKSVSAHSSTTAANMVSNSLKMALSNYLVKMSNTCRSPPKRITLLRKVVPLDNIAKTANKQQCYLPQAGISEFSRQLRTENDNRLCNSRLRGAGEVFLLLLSAKTSHRTAERERATTKEPSGICERCAVKSLA